MNRKIRKEKARHDGSACLWLTIASAAALLVGPFALPANAAAKGDGAAPSPTDISGTWQIESYSPKVKPGVTVVLLNPPAEAAYKKTMAGLKDGSVADAARKSCAGEGLPRIMASPFPFQIAQSAGEVKIKYELGNASRTVIMDKPMPTGGLAASDLGTSYGHWDGDTLVVETMGFTPNTFVDATGLPHSDKLHVSEFFWKTNGGKELQYVAIVQDPITFQQPWMERFAYRSHPEIKIADYHCDGKHRDISAIPGAKDWK